MWKIIFFVLIVGQAYSQNPPNIVMILVDNAGWNDVSYHGSNEYPTPNIDALAYSGIILNRHYSQHICTPSRVALMTSRYPYRTGMGDILFPASAYGLPLSETLMPEYLKTVGYTTRLVGKWHLGSYSEDYTPTFRGFDSFFGNWNGLLDYYAHNFNDSLSGWTGYDLRREMDIEWGQQGEYYTRMLGAESVSIIQNHDTSQPLFLFASLTAPHESPTPGAYLQAPQESIDLFFYIEDEYRRTYAAMFWEADMAIGRIFEALDQKEMLDNTIIMFASDNGGGADWAQSNWPLRGDKGHSMEAGVRIMSFIWSPLLNNPGRVSNQMIHFVDWVPTFLSAAGVSTMPSGIDGINLWNDIVDGSPSSRTETLITIDPYDTAGTVKVGDWKLFYDPALSELKGTWLGSTGRNLTAPEQSWDYILESMLNSTAAQIILSQSPTAYDNVEQLRLNASVFCGSIPSDATPWQQCTVAPCLFNVVEDPCEYYDRSAEEPLIYQQLKDRLQFYNESTVPGFLNIVQEEANPAYWNGTWNNWNDYPSPLNRSMDVAC